MSLSSSTKTALAGGALTALLLGGALVAPPPSEASSHREAPLIADDPLADNTDVYAFRSPTDPSKVILVANYIPLELPEGGPNYNHFGEDIRYEIHVKNKTSVGALGTATDDITYRFEFDRVNEAPTTFFNIRLGMENLNTSYTLKKKVGTGAFQTIVSNGPTPPANIGPRSIGATPEGLGTDYESLTQTAIVTASSGERVFAGPRDDPFFVDLGGIFDLGGLRSSFGNDPNNAANARDAVAGFNVHSLVLEVPITNLQKNSQNSPANILDSDYVIGVWASASRPQITTLSQDGTKPSYSGDFVQVSRLGMPLVNEAIIPIGEKDRWNYTSPYSQAEQSFAEYFVNPELALYMGGGQFAASVPALSSKLRIQQNTYPAIGDVDQDGDNGLDFTNGNDGAFELLPLVASGAIDITGTALAVPTRPTQPGVPTALIGDNEPRRLDLLPIFYFGVPNLIPYQLVTGKTGGPLSAGKPFINNFLPITSVPNDGLYGGDMLRLNMAVPVTPRGGAGTEFGDWARLGLIRAAALGITSPTYNTTQNLEFIPHMDGFPNGRRLEDDVTGIELQAVGGAVLAAVGLPYDDAVAGDYSDFGSPFLFDALAFVAGPTRNDVELRTDFPFLANPFNGFSYVKQLTAQPPRNNFTVANEGLGIGAPQGFILEQSFPNPARDASTIRFQTGAPGSVELAVYDLQGRLIQTLASGQMAAGTHEARWNASGVASGTYVYRLMVDGEMVAARRATVVR